MAHNASPLSKASLRQHSLEVGTSAAGTPYATGSAEETETIASSVMEEAEVLHASLKAGSVAQIVVAMIAVVGLLYLLKFVMVTSLAALLLAFILEPLVSSLDRIGIRRDVGALSSVVLVAALSASSCYFLYSRAKDSRPNYLNIPRESGPASDNFKSL
jgi:hypothetical protein